MPTQAATTNMIRQKKDDNNDKTGCLAILFLLVSFSCIFCSSQIALLNIAQERINASMLSDQKADYVGKDNMGVAPLRQEVVQEAMQDEVLIAPAKTSHRQGSEIVILPKPRSPAPLTPAPLVASLPTMSPTLSANSSFPRVETSAPDKPTPFPTRTSEGRSSPVPSPAKPTPSISTPPPLTTAPPPIATPLPVATTPLPIATIPPTLATMPPPAPTLRPTSRPTSAQPTSVPQEPKLAFMATTFNAVESDGYAIITVLLDKATDKTVTVNYLSQDGTAMINRDYLGALYGLDKGELTFTPAQTRQTFMVSLLDDVLYESPETVLLSLTNPTNATISTPDTAILTILDNEPFPLVHFSRDNYGINEVNGLAIITATLDTASAVTVTVNYRTSNGTALADYDYQARQGTLLFSPEQTETTFSVPIINDDLPEGYETVGLTLDAPIEAVLGTPHQAILSITDAPTIQFSHDNYVVQEIEPFVTLTATLSMASVVTITAHYNTVNGTAMAEHDYWANSGEVIFFPGQTSQAITITIIDDTDGEMNETFTVLLTDFGLSKLSGLKHPSQIYLPVIMRGCEGANGIITPGPSPSEGEGRREPSPYQGEGRVGVDSQSRTLASATVTIISNDPPTVQFSRPDYIVNENEGAATITVTMDAPVSWPIEISYTTQADTAIPTQDYTSMSGTLTFAPGETWQTFIVPILEDTLQEMTKSLQLILSPAPSLFAPYLPIPTSTLTILDNDHSPQVQFSQAAYQANESDSLAVLTVTLSSPSGLTVTVDYRVNGDSSPSNGLLVFPPLATTAYLQFPITNNILNEPSKFVSLTLSNPLNAMLGAIVTATLTIADDDPPPTVQFSTTQYFVNESEPFATIAVNLSAPSGFTTSVHYATIQGEATPALDYTAISGTLTFPPGETTATFLLPITDDNVYEANETAMLQLDSSLNLELAPPNMVTLTIVDNDSLPLIALSSYHYSLNENDGPAIITVTLSQSAELTVTVEYHLADGTAQSDSDYIAVSGTLVFSPYVTVSTFLIPITNDEWVEADETFNVVLDHPLNGIGVTPVATVTIVNDDTFPMVQFDSPTYYVAENNSTAIITVTLSKPPLVTATVAYSSHDVTALAGHDYLALNDTLTFAPMITTAYIFVPITDNVVVEPDKIFALTLISSTNTMTNSFDVASINIINDDSLQAQFTTDHYQIDEFVSAVMLTVTLNTISSEPAMLDCRTHDGSAIGNSDYTPISRTLLFAAGQSMVTVTIPITNDTATESTENFFVALSNPTSAVGMTLGLTNSVEITMVDNDTPAVQFTQNVYQVNEHDGQAIITAVLSFAATIPTSITYQTTDIWAQAGNDYTAVTGTLTFAAGQISQTFTIPISDDANIEPTETFTVMLSYPFGVTFGLTSTALVSIVDNDTPMIQFVTRNYNQMEDKGAVALAVMLSKSVNATVTVIYSTTSGTAIVGSDTMAIIGTLTFAPYQISQTLVVPIIADSKVEPNETFGVSLSHPSNGILAPATTATVTILNDDLPTVQFAQSSYSVNENWGVVVIDVTLNQPSFEVVTVDITTNNGTAIAGSDYVAIGGTLTFAPAQTTQTLTLNIIDDSANELAETFMVALSKPVSATLGLPNSVAVTIIDNDLPQVRFKSGLYAVSENAGSVAVEVELNMPAASVVTVNYATSNVTAIGGTDYTATNDTVTFNIGETSKNFAVPIINDGALEGDETFNVALSLPSGVVLGTPSSATVIIGDDETAPPVPVCSKVTFNITTNTSNPPTVTTVIMANNNYTNTITLRGGSLVVHKNSDEGLPVTTSNGSISTTVPNFLIYTFKSPYSKSIMTGGTYLLTATYWITTPPPVTTDDTFEISYTSTNSCYYAAPVASPSVGGTLAVTIDSPTPFQVVNNDSQANFKATTTPAIQADKGWVIFEIIHVASGTSIWSSIEYMPDFCAFGGNGPCDLPSGPAGFNWNLLTNGTYKLVVTANDFNGNVATASQFFIINGH